MRFATSNSTTAPRVATRIALTRPLPTRMPVWRRSHVPMNAPTMPIAMSPTRPKPPPATSSPASQPAIRPTRRMMSSPSPEIVMAASPSLERQQLLVLQQIDQRDDDGENLDDLPHTPAHRQHPD